MNELPRVRVTELDVWAECHWKHELHYSQRLRLIPDPDIDRSYLLSGSAIHFGIESGLQMGMGLQGALSAAQDYLDAHGGDKAPRFRAGVQTAIEGLPSELWALPNPVTEDELLVHYDLPPLQVAVVGKPDLWTQDEDGVYVTDFKSTSKEETDRLERYELYNVQLPFYGVLIHDWLKAQNLELPPIYLRHLVLSTRGKHAYGSYKLLTAKRRDEMREMMLHRTDDILFGGDITFADSNPGFGCLFCDYQSLCDGYLTGADTEGILKERYRYEPERHS